VVSVGAISAADPGIDTIETFSSRGPTESGAFKPDAAAIDGVDVTGSGGFSTTFFGTSASAPHVAAMAALLLEMYPELMDGEIGDDPADDREALRDAILGTAVDLGDPGLDNVFGHGRVNGVSAAQSLETPTPTPSPTPEPVPSSSEWSLAVLGGVFVVLMYVMMRRRKPAA
jgi:subtilisin family serine protease